MNKSVVRIVLLLGVLGGGVGGVSWVLLSPAGSPRVDDIITVPQGASLKSVAGLLEGHRLIRNKIAFVWLAKVAGFERRISPGEYALHSEMTPYAILDKLVRGDVVQHAVTIPEGFSLAQVADLLANKQLLDRENFLRTVHDQAFIRGLGLHVNSLEGYVFPDTYYWTRPVSPETVIRSCLARLHETITPQFQKRAKELGMSIHEVLTLASVIEKETGKPSERPLISGVFHNRLKQDIPLQSDPTVIYALDQFNGDLTKKDLRVDHAYNTYRVKGLPPGPIANPGRAAIEAALYPARTNFLYFVSRNDGSHQFSATLDEHNLAVREYQLRGSGRSS